MLHGRLPRLDLPRHTYFLTCCLDRRQPLLRDPGLAELVLNLYAEQRDRGAIALHGYVVMPDHYHVVLSLRDAASVSAVVRAVHSLFARDCRRITGLRGRVWQRRLYDHVVRDEEDLRTKLTYMHGNPVAAGLVEEAIAYAWSSFRFWERGIGPVRCDPWE